MAHDYYYLWVYFHLHTTQVIALVLWNVDYNYRLFRTKQSTIHIQFATEKTKRFSPGMNEPNALNPLTFLFSQSDNR